MKARQRYAVKVARRPDRVDSVEVVDLTDGEVVLFWDCEARTAARMAATLREDLARLDADEFLDRWSAVDSDDLA